MNAHQKIEMITFSRKPASKPVGAAARAELLKDPGFGRVFTDHMVTIRWTKDRGWHDAEVRAREPISLDPAAAVLHYGQEIFEGLKAYTLKRWQYRVVQGGSKCAALPRLRGAHGVAGAAGSLCSCRPSRNW